MSTPSTRVACLRVADLPLAAELRANPEPAGRPLVVVSAPGPRAFVVSASPEARAHGARIGASCVHARAVCADLHVRVASPALERAARDTLLDAALAFSPRVAAAPPATGAFLAEASVFLDASGIGSLFRSEETFAAALAARSASLGLPAVVCVASSQEIARLAARRLALESETGRVLVIPPGGEADFLAPLPMDLLDPPDEFAASLTRFGIRTLGDLLRLPPRALATRLGPEAPKLLARVRGEGHEPPLPHHRETRCEEALDLEHPIERLEPLGFVLRGMLSRLVDRLDARGLACGPLTLELALEGGRRDARRIGVAAATNETRTLLRLVNLALEQRPPAAPVVSVALGTRGRPGRRDQLDLFRPAGPAPAELSRTLAELEALCGEGRVGAPALRDEHRPDAFALEPFALQVAEASTRKGKAPKARTKPAAPKRPPPSARLGVRALRPPQPAEVTAPGGRPQWVRSRVATGRVVSRSGPWRTTGGWWSPERRHAFDHWDIATSDGTIVRLRHDRVAHRWEIDGIYD
ncbi:MAG: DNA polymerase Y family protein [Deltaproteobacteria bacterium]|nr:DNA polymerase Y family protein [Deltaproteobacteria bacterium]MBW2445118.1 DNA polymerase Y family protein [Deltaproteobacteria bacterium]